MNTFIFIRHGESTAVNYLAGRTPVSLSEKGKKEAEATALMLSKIRIDKLISSPLKRTLETAEYISHVSGLDIEIMDDFIETDFGKWTGRTFTDLKADEKWNMWYAFRSGMHVPEGENLISVQNRVINGIHMLQKKYPDKTIAVVSHGDPIRSVFLYYLGMPIDMIARIKINTASVSILKLADITASVSCYNLTPDIGWLDI